MPGIAAFDFDGTLSRRDTFLPFAASLVGRRRLTTATARALSSTARSRPWSRDRFKVAFCQRILSGRDRSTIETVGARHAAAVLDHGMRPAALRRLAWHHEQGHRVVIVSASLDAYLGPVARSLDTDLLCTVIDYDVADRATGRLVGGNCRAAEKARRLRTWIAEQGLAGPVWAYGDSDGDVELLESADHPFWVGRARAAVPAEVLT